MAIYIKYPQVVKIGLIIIALLLMLFIAGLYKYTFNKYPCLYLYTTTDEISFNTEVSPMFNITFNNSNPQLDDNFEDDIYYMQSADRPLHQLTQLHCTERDKEMFFYLQEKFKFYNKIGYLLITLAVIYFCINLVRSKLG